MKYDIYSYVIATVILCSSCYKDKNNYNVEAINEAKITMEADSFSVMQLSELILSPEVKSSLHESDSYTYEWKIFGEKAKMSTTDAAAYSEVLANTKDLKETITTPPGKYTLLYTVTNRTNGVKSFKDIKLTVNSGFYQGLVVGYEKENRAELGFIRADNEVRYELIHTLNEKSELNGKLQSVNTLIVGLLKQMAVTTSTNTYLIDVDDFSVLKDKNSLFNTAPEDFMNSYLGGNKLYYNYDAPSDVYYINHGKVYADMGPDFGGSMAGMYSQAFYYAGGAYNLFPFLFNGDNGADIYFYDNLNGKFLKTGFNQRSLSDVSFVKDVDKFDPTKVKKTAISAMLGYDNKVYYIMQDGNAYYIYTMLQYKGNIASEAKLVNLAKVPEFAQARIFDARSDQQDIYYVVQNKLYLYNLASNAARVVLTLGDGEDIAGIHVYRSNMWQNSTDTNFNKRIYIATNKGDQGKVYQYGILADGSLSSNAEKEFNGFGKIVSITYRNPNEK
ncbi:PKD-like family lipoprotein [Sphingobacterium faecale]|uniref:PKD family protein n=1 Tax=Sphingobacterium faecale TaxID=2803775 RepID=A0ABS1R437_9SPHI|nr:PKD-like family lipoprotein [Sphingobacterium faecale]MBL1409468.1 hypothetical protein [Sphingobacterium faecale]